MRFAAANIAFNYPKLQQRAPSTGARITATCAVGVYRDPLQFVSFLGALFALGSTKPRTACNLGVRHIGRTGVIGDTRFCAAMQVPAFKNGNQRAAQASSGTWLK